MAKLYVIGIGPGGIDHMTIKAVETIKKMRYYSRIYSIY